MSALGKIRDSDANVNAALEKLRQLANIDPYIRSDPAWSKAIALLRSAIDGMPRCACGLVTDTACSDCRLDGKGVVYVCAVGACMDAHESVARCTPPITRRGLS